MSTKTISEDNNEKEYWIQILEKVFWMVVLIWLVNNVYQKIYLEGEKKPFWKGQELLQVCKHPYYSSEDCSKYLVTLIDDKRASINFSDQNNKIVGDLTCYFAYKPISDQPRYVFCRSWDSEGQQWDLMPSWAYYPSSEDLMKEMENIKNK